MNRPRTINTYSFYKSPPLHRTLKFWLCVRELRTPTVHNIFISPKVARTYLEDGNSSESVLRGFVAQQQEFALQAFSHSVGGTLGGENKCIRNKCIGKARNKRCSHTQGKTGSKSRSTETHTCWRERAGFARVPVHADSQLEILCFGIKFLERRDPPHGVVQYENHQNATCSFNVPLSVAMPCSP